MTIAEIADWVVHTREGGLSAAAVIAIAGVRTLLRDRAVRRWRQDLTGQTRRLTGLTADLAGHVEAAAASAALAAHSLDRIDACAEADHADRRLLAELARADADRQVW